MELELPPLLGKIQSGEYKSFFLSMRLSNKFITGDFRFIERYILQSKPLDEEKIIYLGLYYGEIIINNVSGTKWILREEASEFTGKHLPTADELAIKAPMLINGEQTVSIFWPITRIRNYQGSRKYDLWSFYEGIRRAKNGISIPMDKDKKGNSYDKRGIQMRMWDAEHYEQN